MPPKPHPVEGSPPPVSEIETECCVGSFCKEVPMLGEAATSRHKLIETTLTLMATRGYEATSVQDILEASGVTKSNFYYHFKSKEELALLALDVLASRGYEFLMRPTLLNRALSPAGRLMALFDVIETRAAGTECQGGCPFVNLAVETSDFHPAFRERLTHFFEGYRQLIARTLKEGIEGGEFRPDLDSEVTSYFVLSLIQGVIVMTKTLQSVAAVQHSRTLLGQALYSRHPGV